MIGGVLTEGRIRFPEIRPGRNAADAVDVDVPLTIRFNAWFEVLNAEDIRLLGIDQLLITIESNTGGCKESLDGRRNLTETR